MQKGPSKADLDLQLFSVKGCNFLGCVTSSVSSALDMKIVYRPEDTSAFDLLANPNSIPTEKQLGP